MKRIFLYQAFSDFFYGYHCWQESKVWKFLDVKLNGFDNSLKLEYDFLFRGTHAEIKIPLWASACKEHGKILCDQTTLELIMIYFEYGYTPCFMDGNPADYIGEILRFLVYLQSAQRSERSKEQKQIIDDLESKLLKEYLEPMIAYIVAGIREHTSIPVFLKAAEWMTQLVLVQCQPDISTFIKLPNIELCDFKEIRKQGLNGKIEINEPERMLTAGINNCGGLCVIAPLVQQGCMLNIETDQSNNHPQLKACVRGRGYRKTFLSSERLRYPMKRVGERGAGTFERISWTEAIEILTAEWKRIKKQYGVSSRYVMYATGITGIMRPTSLIKRLLSLDGGFLDYYNSYSSACSRYITPYIYGTTCSGNSMSDILYTKLMILWGHNPVETHFGTERPHYLHELKKKGIKIIVIDPRFSDTAAVYADQWIPIRPSTDSALADGMAYVIWSECLQDQDFMDQFCVGFDEEHLPEGIPAGESYYSYLFGAKDGVIKTPEWAQVITGIPADVIRTLAREYAGAKPACLMVGLGLQRTGNGEQTIRSTAMLTCLTGNVGKSGGSAGGVGDVIEHLRLELAETYENPYPGKIPVFQWTKATARATKLDEVHDGLKGVRQLDSNIKMIFNLAGNTLVNQHADINHTIRLLKDRTKCEFIVCSDLFMTPSARYADLLLPGTSVFEGDNIGNPWTGGNYLLSHKQVLKPLFECRFEWEWMKQLSKNLNLYEEFTAGKPEVEDWLKESYKKHQKKEAELPDYDIFRRLGGWQYKSQINYIAFEKELAKPEQYPFQTPSGKIEIFSLPIYQLHRTDEIAAIPKYIACQEGPEDPLKNKYPLQLIGWHTKRRAHSIHDNNEWMDEVEAPALWMHPEDAAIRGINQNNTVLIYNLRGQIKIPVQITHRVMQGVVAMSQGGWYRPDKDGVDRRGSINVLTSEQFPSPLAKGNPQHINLVEVRRYN